MEDEKKDISQHKVYERNFPDGSREVIFETDENGRPIWAKALEEAANWKPVADPEVREPHPYFDNPTAQLESLLRRTWYEAQKEQTDMKAWIESNRFLYSSFLKVAPDNQEELWNEVKMAFFSFDTKTEAIDWLKSKFSISRKPQQE